MGKRKRPSAPERDSRPPPRPLPTESISVLRSYQGLPSVSHRVENAGISVKARNPRRGRHATSPTVSPGQGEHVPSGPRGDRANAAGPSVDLRSQPGDNNTILEGSDSTEVHVKVDSALEQNTGTDALIEQPPAAHLSAPADDNTNVGAIVEKEAAEGPNGEGDLEDEEEVREALSRPPPVNSDILPLPWKGRLGYACLNTYLRAANPPVFSSRTCRIASILEHRHPLKDPSQPEHATKNRPDRDQPADVVRGNKYVQDIGLANVRDIIKMVRWNDRFGIRFMRLSSEMFPFASHPEYGYKLAPFASDALAEAGRVIAELGHRVTTHPGQFTQLGSPRREVIDNAVRDLEYHDEMLSLLKLPPQQDRDAVMILHLGGVFGDKTATLDRFRENYAKLSSSVKNRLVLENDDVSWSVHDLLPLCQELNIPLVLDFHHHNIVFDATKVREGTKDVIELFPAIIETWKRKGITPKMHYSEPCPDAVTARGRRKHSPRVMTLPPCPNDMDLMIEAKDKEQAVFELMRTFKLPGYHLFNDVVPHVRTDENKPFKPKLKPKTKKKAKKKKEADDLEAVDEQIDDAEEPDVAPPLIPEEELHMGGPLRRVYWPPGMEHWLRPPKRVVKKREETVTVQARKKTKVTVTEEQDAALDDIDEEDVAPATKKAGRRKVVAAKGKKGKVAARKVPTPSPSDEDDESPLSDLGDEDEGSPIMEKKALPVAPSRRKSGRAARVSYKEEDVD